MNAEKQIVWLPVVAGTLLAVNGIVGAFVTGSQAVLTDGLFSVVYVITGLFTVYVSRILQRPISDKYPFGHGAYEPLTNLIKALLLFVVMAFVTWEAVAMILAGGKSLEFGAVIVFTLISACISLSAAGFAWWRSRDADTPLVKGEMVSWALDAVSIVGVTVALLIAWWLDVSGHEAMAGYVDPGIAIVLVAVTIYSPYSLGKEALFQLLQRAPAAKKRAPFEQGVRDVTAVLPITNLEVRMLEMGRFTWVSVTATLDRFSSDLSVSEADTLRSQLQRRLEQIDANVQSELHLTFKNNERPAAAIERAH